MNKTFVEMNFQTRAQKEAHVLRGMPTAWQKHSRQGTFSDLKTPFPAVPSARAFPAIPALIIRYPKLSSSPPSHLSLSNTQKVDEVSRTFFYSDGTVTAPDQWPIATRQPTAANHFLLLQNEFVSVSIFFTLSYSLQTKP